eukprot:UN20962
METKFENIPWNNLIDLKIIVLVFRLCCFTVFLYRLFHNACVIHFIKYKNLEDYTILLNPKI